MAVTLENLVARLEDATRGLAHVSSRRAFASPGFFAGSAMFAFAWKSALRIVVKLPDEASRASLLGIEGAAPWTPTGKRMGAWVMVPEAWHDDVAALRPWVRRAYEQVLRGSAEDEVPSMGEQMPAKLRATETKKKTPAAIETLHDGVTPRPRVEKPGTRTAAVPAPRKAAKKSAAKKKPHQAGLTAQREASFVDDPVARVAERVLGQLAEDHPSIAECAALSLRIIREQGDSTELRRAVGDLRTDSIGEQEARSLLRDVWRAKRAIGAALKEQARVLGVEATGGRIAAVVRAYAVLYARVMVPLFKRYPTLEDTYRDGQ